MSLYQINFKLTIMTFCNFYTIYHTFKELYFNLGRDLYEKCLLGQNLNASNITSIQNYFLFKYNFNHYIILS